MRTFTYLISVIVVAMSICACGVESPQSPDDVGSAPNMAGDWQVVLVAIKGTCPLLEMGLAANSPLNIEDVEQSGNNLSGSFEVDGTSYQLSGDIVLGYLTVVIESFGGFIETLGASAETPTFAGSFNGKDLTVECTESGVFVAAIGQVEAPVVTGEWTLTLSGVAAGCDDPSDEGGFLRILNNITASSTRPGTVYASYEDPAGVSNTLAAAVLDNRFTGGISEVAIPPERVAFLDGRIDASTNTISGDLEGELAFPGGDCDVKGNFEINY